MDACSVYGVKGKYSKQTNWIYAKFNTNDRFEIDVLISRFNNGLIAKWGEENTYINSKGEEVSYLKDRTDIIKLNKRDFLKLVTDYYSEKFVSIKNSALKRASEDLNGWTSTSAKHAAINYTARIIKEEYIKNLSKGLFGSIEGENNPHRLNKNGIISKVRTNAIDNFFSKFDTWINASKKFEDETNILEGTSENLYENKLKTYKEKIDAYNKASDEYNNKRKDENATQEELNILEQKVISARQSVFDFEVATVDNYCELATLRNISRLAQELYGSENASKWINLALSTRDMVDIVKSFDNLKIEQLAVEDYNMQDDLDADTNSSNEEVDSLDRMTSIWDDSFLKSYILNYDTRLKLYLSLLPQQTIPVVGRDNDMVLTNPELGTPEYIDVNYALNTLQSIGPVRDENHFIQKLERKVKIDNNVFGLGKLVNDMKANSLFARYVVSQFSKPVLTKIQNSLNDEYVSTRVSNRESFGVSKVYYDLIAESDAVGRGEYNEQDTIMLQKDLKESITQDQLLNPKGVKRNSIKNDIVNFVKKHFPSINRENLVNWFFDNPETATVENLHKFIKTLIDYNKGLYKALINENEYKSKFSIAYNKYKKQKAAAREGEQNFVFAPEYREEEINRKDRNAALIDLSNILLDVANLNVRFNTSNAEGKTSSSVGKNSYLTDFFKQLKVELENGKDGREITKEFFTKKKYDITDVETNPILFGLKDENGKVIQQGIFYKDKLGEYHINENAFELLNAFGVSLYDGAKKAQSNNGIVYDSMTREDFLLSSIFTFNAAIRFEGNQDVDSKNFGNFLMRIPSDASNIYSIQMPKYSTDELYDYGSETEIKNQITKIVSNLDSEVVENFSAIEKESKSLSRKWKDWLNKLITNNNFVPFRHTLNESRMTSLLLSGKIENVNALDKNNNFIDGDYVYVPYVYKSDDISFVVLTKGKLDENKLFAKEATIEFIHSIKKKEYEAELDDYEFTINDTMPTTPMIQSFLENNLNSAKEILFEQGVIERKYNRNSPMFLAYRNELWGELQQFATNLNNVFEEDSDGNLVSTTSLRGLFDSFHYKDDNIVKDGKLTGNIFKFTKLFNVGFDVNDAIEKAFALYDAKNNDNYSEPLFITNSEGNLVINSNRVFELNSKNKADLFYLLGKTKTITVGDDYQKHIKGYINDTINNIVEQWLSSYTTYINEESKVFDNIVNSSYNNVSFESWALNAPLAYMIFDGLFEGSSKYYKDAQTFIKRAKETQMGGTAYIAGTFGEFREDLYDIPAPDGNSIEISIEKDGKNLLTDIPSITNEGGVHNKKFTLRNGFRAITIKNSKTKYGNATIIYDTLKKNILNSIAENKENPTQEEVKAAHDIALSMAREFGNVSVTTSDGTKVELGKTTKANDAQSYITIEEFIRRKYADGTLDQYQEILSQLLDDKVDIKDINLSDVAKKIQIQKNVYYDIVYDEITGQHRPRQIKNAEFVLIPKLLDKDSSLYKLYQLMRKHDIGQVNTLETSKASNRDILTYWDDNGNVDIEAFESSLTGIPQGATIGRATYPAVENYYYNHLYKQLDVVDHIEDKENKAGIQLFKKIQDNVTKTTEEYANAIQEGFSANIRESYFNLLDKLGWKLQNGSIVNSDGTPNLNRNYFYRECLREFQRVGLDKNVEDYLIPGNDGVPLMPDWYPILSTKLENIAQSIFNNNITRQTIGGYHGVQSTNIGWSRKLRYFPVEEGKQLPVVEIMIPAYSKPIKDAIKKFGKQKTLELLKSAGLDEHIGYRIPTEGKQSMAVFRIVDFLDEEYGSTIVVPNEWVTQTGSDFDVDSIYSLVHSLSFRNGEFKKISYNIDSDEDSVKFRYLIKLREISNIADKKAIAAHRNDFETIKKIGNKNNLNFDDFAKLSPVEQLTKDARDNYILDNVINILKDENSFEEIFSRSNYDDIVSAKDSIEESSNTGFSKASVYNPFDQLRFMQNSIDGKKLKALSVNRDTFVSINNRVQTYLPEELGIRVVYGEQYNKDIINSAYGEENIENKYSTKTNFNSFNIIQNEFLSRIKYIKYGRSGQIIDSLEKGKRICNGTQMLCLEMIGDAFNNGDIAHNVKAWPITIWAKSPLSEDIIDHETTLVKINGTFYIFDMPQSEFITKTGNKFKVDDKEFNEGIIGDFKPYLIPINENIISEKYEINNDYLKHTISSINNRISDLNNKYNFEIKLNVDNSITIKNNYEFNKVIVNHRMFGWSNNNRNVVGKLITAYSSQTTAHILDAVKEGALFNETLYTFGAFKTLIDLGIDYDTAISWLYQPAITRINNINNETNSIYLDIHKNPQYEAISQIAKELNLTQTDYISEEDIYKKLNELYKDDVEELLNEVFFTNLEDKKFAINGEALQNRLQEKDVNGKENITDSKFNTRNLIFDLITAIQFKNYKSLTTNIENIAKVLRPDSFGAKQIIREVRNIVNDVNSYIKTYTDKDGNEVCPADILYQIYNGEKRNIIKAIYTEDNSSYKYLYNFYKYATKASLEVNSAMFATEHQDFQNVVTDIENKIGRKLTNEEYLKAKKYIVSSVFKSVPMLCSPVEIDEHNFAIIDKSDIYEHADEPYWETETGRIYGFVETESNNPKIDLANPTIEELNVYKKLTPAQKILFIKSNFENPGFFDKVSVTKFFKNEITNKHYSYNRIYLNDLSYNIEDIRNQFEAALYNSNPIIKLAAIDVLKYAFIVEGYNFRGKAVSKAIPNKAIIRNVQQGALNILDSSKKAFDDIIRIPNFVENYVADNFVRANSDLINPIYIKKESGTKDSPTISDLLLKCIRFNQGHLIAIPKSEEYTALREKLGFKGRTQNYKRLQYNIGNGYKTHLFKLMSDPVLNYDYLIPLNLLEEFENTDVSINRANNEFKYYQYYLDTILEETLPEIGENEEAYIKEEKTIDTVASELEEEDRSSTIDWIQRAITKTKEELLKDLPKYKYKNVTDEYKLINTWKTGNAAEKAQLTKFFNDINDALDNENRLPEGVKNNVFKNSSPLVKKLLGIVGVNGFVSFYIPKGATNTKVKISPYKGKYLIEKTEGTIKKYKDNAEISYYTDKLGGVHKGDVLYKVKVMSEQEIDEREIVYDERASYYNSIDELFTDTNTFDSSIQRNNISTIIVKDLRFNARHADDYAIETLNSIRTAGININSIKSLNENYKTVYSIANKYYRKAYDSLIAKINDFELENGNSYAIDDTRLYQEATPRDFQNLLTLVLNASHFIENLNDLSIYNFSGIDDSTNKEISLLKEYSENIRNNGKIKVAFNKIFNKYMVREYSTNPLLQTSFTDVQGQKHYMLDATDIFGDISASANLISDIGHIPNKQIQMIVKAINQEIYAAEYSGRQKVLAFDRFINKEIGENPNEIFNKIIDKNGKIIQPYTDDFILDYYNKRDELNAIEDTNGRYSKQYFEKKLKFDKWAVRNLEQEIVKPYYEKLISIKENAYKVLGEKLIRYMQIEYLLYNEYDDSYALTEEQIEEKKKLLLEVQRMRDLFNEDGDFKPVEEIKQVEALNEYIKSKQELNKKYFETQEFEEFKQNLEHNLNIIKEYDSKHPSETINQKLENLEYNVAYKWILSNTRYTLNKEATKTLADAYSKLGINYIDFDVRNIYAEKQAKGTLHDIYGRIIGTNFTEDEIKIIHDAQQTRYNLKVSTNNKGYEDLVDYKLYKNVPPHRILSRKFWEYYNGSSQPDYDYRKNVEQINNKINNLISKGVNKNTGLIELHRLYTNCTQEELDELINLYKELRKLDRLKEEDVEKSGKKVFIFKSNNAAFAKQYDVYSTSKIAAERRLFEAIFCDIDANGVIKRTKNGRIVPSKYLYGYVELKPSVLKEHPEFIDTEKENALKLLEENEEFVPTEYYYDALEKNRKEAQALYDKAKSEGKSDKQAEIIRDNHIDTWYQNNHIWNRYTGTYQPISIWTERRIKATGSLAQSYDFEPTYDNLERSVKEKYRNPNYSVFRTNYNTDGDYTNSAYENIFANKDSKEAKLYREVEAIMNAARINNNYRRFLDEGWAPRKYKIKPDTQWVVKQGLAALGINFKDYNNKSWTDNINYRSDHAVPNSMLQSLKFPGYEQYQRIPTQDFGQTDEDYNKVIKEITKANREIAQRNLEKEKAYRDEDWYNVFRQFIYNQEQVNARENVKNLAYVTIDDIKQRNAYKVNGFGKVSVSRYSQDSSPDYINTPQRRLEEIYSNWLRRILYGEYKELSPYNKVADTLQNMSSAKYMMFNIYAAINNVSVGAVNILGEVFAKEYFDSKTWLEASKEYSKSIFYMLKDTFSDTSQDRITAILKLFNAIEIDRTLDFTGGDFELSKFSEYFNTVAYSLQSSGEHAMQNRALIAMLKSHRVVIDSKTGKKKIMSYNDYANGIELAALRTVLQNDEYSLEKLNMLVASAKQDKQLQYEYDNLRRNIITDFFKSVQNSSQKKQIYDEFVALRKEMFKNSKEEFEKYEDVWSQFEVTEEGIAQFKPESGLNDSYFGDFKNKVVYVNKKIHGVYDKNGAAQIEKKWYGSLVMQFKKHIYPGIMKRWRRRGYYNENTGTFEKGSYISLFDFLSMEFKTFNDKKNKKLGVNQEQVADAQEQTYQTNAALASIQTIFECIIDTIHNFKYNYNILPAWEQNNIRRSLADLCGIMSALLTVFIIYALTDDDDLEDSTLLNSTLYLADRLYGESRMYMPQGIVPEVRTQWSQPIAGAGVIKDLYTAMGAVTSWLFDENYSPVYEAGPHKGQNKVSVVVKRNIPIVRTIQRISTINSSNKYYRIGDNGVSQHLIKNIAIKVRNE